MADQAFIIEAIVFSGNHHFYPYGHEEKTSTSNKNRNLSRILKLTRYMHKFTSWTVQYLAINYTNIQSHVYF